MSRCAACDRTVSEGSGREPHFFEDREFCDRRCAERWSYHQLPKVSEVLRTFEQFRSTVRRVLLKARPSVARSMVVEALKAIRQ